MTNSRATGAMAIVAAERLRAMGGSWRCNSTACGRTRQTAGEGYGIGELICFLVIIWLVIPPTSSASRAPHSLSREVRQADAQVQTNDIVNREAERLRDHVIRKNEEAMFLKAMGHPL